MGLYKKDRGLVRVREGDVITEEKIGVMPCEDSI